MCFFSNQTAVHTLHLLPQSIWYYYITYICIHCLRKGGGGGNLRGGREAAVPEHPPFKALIANLPPDIDTRVLRDDLFHGYVKICLLPVPSISYICGVLSVVIINNQHTHIFLFFRKRLLDVHIPNPRRGSSAGMHEGRNAYVEFVDQVKKGGKREGIICSVSCPSWLSFFAVGCV